MEFNLAMCKLMHFGKLSQGRTYTVNGRALGSVDEQRDLEVQIHSSMKVEHRVDKLMPFISYCVGTGCYSCTKC